MFSVESFKVVLFHVDYLKEQMLSCCLFVCLLLLAVNKIKNSQCQWLELKNTADCC